MQISIRTGFVFLHSKVNDQVIEENYQKTLTKKKYNMLSFSQVIFKADKVPPAGKIGLTKQEH